MIYFFEYSDLNRKPLEFKTLDDFEDFCMQYNIYMYVHPSTSYLVNANYTTYMTCYPGINILLMSRFKDQLKWSIETTQENYPQYLELIKRLETNQPLKFCEVESTGAYHKKIMIEFENKTFLAMFSKIAQERRGINNKYLIILNSLVEIKKINANCNIMDCIINTIFK